MEFNQTEKTAILGLIRNPEHPDKEISSSLNMSMFTFNKIKNSLIKEGSIRKYYVPSYKKLGYGILMISHGSGFGPLIGRKTMKDLNTGERGAKVSNMIFGIFEGDNGLAFHLLRDYSDLKHMMKEKERMMEEMDLDQSALEHVIIPTKDLKVDRFFDIQDILQEDLKGREVPILDPETPAQSAAMISWSEFFAAKNGNTCIDLDDDSLRALYEVVKCGGSSDIEHMERLGLSRYRFNRIKDTLLEEGFIKPYYAVNIMGLGLGVMIFTHFKMKPSHDPSSLFTKYHDKIPKNLMIAAYDSIDMIGLGVFRDFPTGSEAQMKMRRSIMDRGYLRKEPTIRVFSLPNIKTGNDLTYHRPISSLLEERGLPADP